jgi:hypothetical protein
LGKVVNFKSKQQRQEEALSKKMIQIADQIDDLIVEHLNKGMDHKEIAALLAHRLATLVRNFPDQQRVMEFVEKLMQERLKESS